MATGQLAVWMDEDEARIFVVDDERFDEATVLAPKHHLHRHPKSQLTREHHHPDDEPRFFREIARALAGAAAILVVGPSMTKLHFLRYLQVHDRALESRVVGLETVDHPTDRQIAAYVRSYFGGSPGRDADA